MKNRSNLFLLSSQVPDPPGHVFHPRVPFLGASHRRSLPMGIPNIQNISKKKNQKRRGFTDGAFQSVSLTLTRTHDLQRSVSSYPEMTSSTKQRVGLNPPLSRSSNDDDDGVVDESGFDPSSFGPESTIASRQLLIQSFPAMDLRPRKITTIPPKTLIYNQPKTRTRRT